MARRAENLGRSWHPFLRRGREGKFSREILQRPTTSYPSDAWLWPRRVKRKRKEAAGEGKVTRAEGERWGGGRKDRELSPTMRSLPTWWIEVSFENVCAHGQIHKEGCKPRLRPSSGGSLIFRTKFHPIPPADDAVPAPPRDPSVSSLTAADHVCTSFVPKQ